ncbi:MAG: hypothetical protein A3I63_05445 [Betaproteobacteria bacterium RIFCSPLOWO2_02_FULL_66_14]|nr:MAG: hypothetical protein A3I63_05445 [Betaproteobacteria bacterium RIFCSPLOWO2_02_FULL_66_14]
MPTANPPAIRVFIIDDHRTILWGLERLMASAKPPMTVVGSATHCAAALDLLGEVEPDVILLDLDLGKESGLDAIPKLAAKSSARILVLTGVRDKKVHDQAVLAGARGIVEKESPAETILAAIGKVHAGELWLDRAAAGRLFVEISRRDAPPKPDPEHRKIDSLTDREREIVAAATANAGANARAIAESLGISESTLRNHLTSIYSKLGVDSRLALFAYAHKHDLARPKS